MGIYLIGEVIRRTRESLNMTQEQLSEGICQTETLSRIENGKNTPSRETYEKLMSKMKKRTEKYQPLVRADGIRAHLLREKLEREIRAHRNREARQTIRELNPYLLPDDKVNRQYILWAQAVTEYRGERIATERYRELLVQALRCTIPEYEAGEVPETALNTQEIRILCNLALTYYEEKKLDLCIRMQERLEKRFAASNMTGMEVLEAVVEANLGQTLGNQGEYQRCIEKMERARNLELTVGEAGHMPHLLYDTAFCEEKLGQEERLCRERLRQAYYLAEFYDDDYMKEHIRKHLAERYGEKAAENIAGERP